MKRIPMPLHILRLSPIHYPHPKFDVLRRLLETRAIGQIKSVYRDDGEY
jgi:hypothetical protein